LGCVECTLGARIDDQCHALGLIVRPIGNMCVFSPPLIITKSQIDEMISILAKAISLTEASLKVQGIL